MMAPIVIVQSIAMFTKDITRSARYPIPVSVGVDRNTFKRLRDIAEDRRTSVAEVVRSLIQVKLLAPSNASSKREAA